MIGIGNHYRHAMAVWRWGFWIRVFGRGIYLAVDDGLRLLSEREGFRRVYRFARLKFQWLKKLPAPSNAALLRLAERYPAPQEWYDE